MATEHTDRDEARPDRAEPPAKRDFRQDLTDQIVSLVEQGTAPWQKPWRAGEALSLPRNATTDRPYRGGNAVLLMLRAQALGSSDPRWCTYKQAQERGWQVRKGARGTGVEYWKFDREDDASEPANGKGAKVARGDKRPTVFYATVFHASQIDGIEPHQAPPRPVGWSPVQAAEDVLSGSGALIVHDQADRAFYSLSADEIHLPSRDAFPTPLDYYEVALHELAHWSGHEDRLARDLSGRFGSETYAREELRAQMASLFMSAELGVPFNPDRHAAYQASWVKALRDDKHEIFRAARDAEAMASYVIGLAQSPTKDAAAPQVEPPQDASAMISAPVVTADAAAAPAVSGGISSERAEQLVAQFLAEYKGFGADGRFPLKIAVLHTERDFHELYGPHADAVIQAFADPARKACVHPSRGLLVLHAGHHRDEEDFNRSLAHEGNGHSGLLAFTAEQKRAVLDGLIAARGSEGRIGLWWQSIDQSEEYASKSLDQRAEEVYCLACEHRQELSQGLHPKALEHVWRHSIEERSEPLQVWSLMQVIEGVAQGLRDDTLVQKIFPLTDDAQFRLEEPAAGPAEATGSVDEPVARLPEAVNPLRARLLASEEFAAQLRAAGLVLDGPPEMDGEFHHVPAAGEKPGKLSGSYWGTLDGQPNGFIQNLSIGFKQSWRYEGQIPKPNQARVQQQAAQSAVDEWSRLREAPSDHAFLLRKGIDNHGLKLDGEGRLVMGLSDVDGRLWSLLRITESGETSISSGGRLRGCFHQVGPEDPSRPLVITESYAAAATLYATTGLPAVCTLNPGNLADVARTLREKYPERVLFIAGDNDHVKELAGELNVAKSKAIEVAQAVGGQLLLPRFDRDDPGSDWNDLAASRGEDHVREQIEAVFQRLAVPDAADEPIKRTEVEPEAARAGDLPSEGQDAVAVPAPLDVVETENAIEAELVTTTMVVQPIGVAPDPALAPSSAGGEAEALAPAGVAAGAERDAASDAAQPPAVAIESPSATSALPAAVPPGSAPKTVETTHRPILSKTGYEVPVAFASRYVVRDGAYWGAQDQAAGKKSGGTQPHFQDTGPKLTTGLQDRRTVADMVAVAQAKHWGSITVKGSEEFRRHAWLEANLAGVQVHGFSPKESDLAMLEAARRQRDDALKISGGSAPKPEANTIASDAKPLQSAPDVPVHTPTAVPTVVSSPASISEVKAIFAKTIEQLPATMRAELTGRLNERLQVGVGVQEQVVRGEVPRRSLGEVLRTQLAQLRFGASGPAGPQATAQVAPTQAQTQPSQQVIR